MASDRRCPNCGQPVPETALTAAERAELAYVGRRPGIWSGVLKMMDEGTLKESDGTIERWLEKGLIAIDRKRGGFVLTQKGELAIQGGDDGRE